MTMIATRHDQLRPTLLFALLAMAACAGPGQSDSGSSDTKPATGEHEEGVTESSSEAATGEGSTADSQDSLTIVEESSAEDGSTSSTGDDDSKPAKLLLIIADDFGIDSALPYADEDGDGTADDGRTYAPMPVVSELCRSGLRFRQAWAEQVCSPTRANILTGRYAFRTGVGTLIRGAEGGIESAEQTLPRLLAEAKTLSIQTASLGKWHLGTRPDLDGLSAPNHMGWPHYAGSIRGAITGYTDWTKVTNGIESHSREYATTDIVDDAIDWIDQHETDESWLMWLGFNAPHAPFHLPPSHLHSADQLSGDADDIKAHPETYYRAAIEAMDTEIGRLLTWLQDHGHSQVHVIFIGDNGTPREVVASPWLPDRVKNTLYQGGVQVPLCIAGPRVAAPGRDIDAIVHAVDLFTTLLDLAGLDVDDLDEKVDGRSLVPLMQDPGAPSPHEMILSETFGSRSSPDGRTIRDERFKLIAYASGEQEMYDLANDPLETLELIGSGLDAEAQASFDRFELELERLSRH